MWLSLLHRDAPSLEPLVVFFPRPLLLVLLLLCLILRLPLPAMVPCPILLLPAMVPYPILLLPAMVPCLPCSILLLATMVLCWLPPLPVLSLLCRSTTQTLLHMHVESIRSTRTRPTRLQPPLLLLSLPSLLSCNYGGSSGGARLCQVFLPFCVLLWLSQILIIMSTAIMGLSQIVITVILTIVRMRLRYRMLLPVLVQTLQLLTLFWFWLLWLLLLLFVVLWRVGCRVPSRPLSLLVQCGGRPCL